MTRSFWCSNKPGECQQGKVAMFDLDYNNWHFTKDQISFCWFRKWLKTYLYYIYLDLFFARKCGVQCYAKHKNYKAVIPGYNHIVFFDGTCFGFVGCVEINKRVLAIVNDDLADKVLEKAKKIDAVNEEVGYQGFCMGYAENGMKARRFCCGHAMACPYKKTAPLLRRFYNIYNV